MAVENALIQSGKALYEAGAETVDTGKAISEGQKIITDQQEKNLKYTQDQEDREFKVKKMEQDEELRTIGLEQKIEQATAEKAEVFSVIEQLKDRGEISGADYTSFQQDREAWWKDKANKLKVYGATGKDVGAFKDRLGVATDAESNWGKFQQHANSMTISSNSPLAQKMNYAISGWTGKTPPPITSKNGRDFFSIPNIDINGDGKIDQSDLDGNYDPSKVSLIPVEGIADGDFESTYGDYEEKSAFSTTLADWSKGNAKGFDRLSKGTGTSTDIASIGTWYEEQVRDNPVKAKEILDTFFVQSGITPGSETANELGIKDTDGDGQITSNDVSDVDMADVFTGAVMSEYDFKDNQRGDEILNEQINQKLKIGKYAVPPKAGKGSGAKGFGPDSSIERRLGTIFSNGSITRPEDLIGLKIDGNRVGTLVYVDGEGKPVKAGASGGQWIAKSTDNKQTWRLGENPTEASIRDAFGADFVNPPAPVVLSDEELFDLDNDPRLNPKTKGAGDVVPENTTVDETPVQNIDPENLPEKSKIRISDAEKRYQGFLDKFGADHQNTKDAAKALEQTKIEENEEAVSDTFGRTKKIEKEISGYENDKVKYQNIVDTSNSPATVKKYKVLLSEIDVKISRANTRLTKHNESYA